MKLYRTRTEEEYNWLMQKLEDEGFFWGMSKLNPTAINNFNVYGDRTIIRANTTDDTLAYEIDSLFPNNSIIEVSDLMDTVDHDTLMQKVMERNNKPKIEHTIGDVLFGNPIEPEHYNKGEIDLFESAYRTRPFNEFRAIMEFVAERYMKRDKDNRIEDLDKAIYTLERLKEYEELEEEE